MYDDKQTKKEIINTNSLTVWQLESSLVPVFGFNPFS